MYIILIVMKSVQCSIPNEMKIEDYDVCTKMLTCASDYKACKALQREVHRNVLI